MKKKTIFTTITLGLVTLLGFGFLGAINSQPKEAKATEYINTKAPRKNKIINLNDIDLLNYKGLLYFEAKYYDNQGKGAYWYGNDSAPSLNNSWEYDTTTQEVKANFTIVKSNNYENNWLNINFNVYNGVRRLYYVYLYTDSNGSIINQNYIFSAPNGTFARSSCAFIAKDFSYINDLNAFIFLVNHLFNVYSLEGNTFTFNSFNPYYLWNVNYSENPYVNFTQYTISNTIGKFYSGGYVFDTIRLVYSDAQDTSFKIGSRYLNTTFSSGQYMYYSALVYYNSASQFSYTVNRQEVIYGSNNETSLSVVVGSNIWVSQELKTIRFLEEPNQVTLNLLENISNTSQISGFDFVYDTDVNLGGAFNLISLAFASWLPIFSISVLPGISLGMLIFLPLIAGIIIFIIWIVKR